MRTRMAIMAAGCVVATTAMAVQAAEVVRQPDVARGRYVVAIAGCNDCHTAGYAERGERMPERERLTGSPVGWRGPWGTTYAANLRLYFQSLSEEQWVETAREMQRRPPMPFYALNAMSDSDVRAIYRYIRQLGPAGEPAPHAVPPNVEPATPYVRLPGAAVAPVRAIAGKR